VRERRTTCHRLAKRRSAWPRPNKFQSPCFFGIVMALYRKPSRASASQCPEAQADDRRPLEEAPGSSGAKPNPPKSSPHLLDGWRRPRLTRADRKAATRRRQQTAFVVAVTRDRNRSLTSSRRSICPKGQ
jgi:hypothetical protein